MQTTDFSKIVQDIRDAGFSSDQSLADCIGVQRSKITKIRLGMQHTVNYDDGVAIMKLYEVMLEK